MKLIAYEAVAKNLPMIVTVMIIIGISEIKIRKISIKNLEVTVLFWLTLVGVQSLTDYCCGRSEPIVIFGGRGYIPMFSSISKDNLRTNL